jgi:HEAT repeat protein
MRPRWTYMILILLVGIASVSGAQDTNRALQAYQDRFRDASPEIKLQILQTADALSVEELGPLYVSALRFALSNADQLSSDIVLQKIVLLATEKSGEGLYAPAATSLWSIFDVFGDNTTRIAILGVLGDVAVGNAEVVLDLNGWVQAQANLYRGGVAPDLQVLNNAVLTLGELGDASSFPVLLDIQLAQISDAITDTARVSMKALPGDYVETAIQTTNNRSISNQLAALNFFLDDPDLSDQERAVMATGVMSNAVRISTRDVTENRALREVRFRAAQELVDVPYEPAAASLIRHFNLTFQSYDRGIIAKTWVLEAVAALGNTGSSAAAARLIQFLDLLNTYTENSRPYDTQIILAVVTNLERLGDLEAYDALFYVTMLDYPQRVKDAARSALDAVTQ